jgi:RHS repeat-associated protein
MRFTLDVFPSLRLANATYDWGTNDYEQNAGTERVFMGGVARVFHASGLPSLGSDRHVFFTIGDRLGSANSIVDAATSELVEQISYHAYGAVESDYRAPRWNSFREDLRFTGKEDEIELGLQYFGARYYSPNLGRFISPDPLTIHGASGDINPYAYVGGRVYNFTDPLGLFGQGCMGNEDCGGGSGWGGTSINVGDAIDAIGCLFGGCASSSGSGPSSNAQRGPGPASPATTLIPMFAANALSATGTVWYGHIPIPGTQNAYFTMSGFATAGRNHAIRHTIGALDPIHAFSVVESVTGFHPANAFTSTVTTDRNDYSNAVAGGFEFFAGLGGGALAGGAVDRSVAQSLSAELGVARAAPTLAADADLLATNGARVPTESGGFFNVVTHADAKSAYVLRNGEFVPVSHRSLAQFIEGSPEYSGQPVRLIACEAGACANGFAQNLSNKLGVQVEGATGSVMIDGWGGFWTNRTWRLFMPGR